MLFHSSLRKEMARSFGATVVVLATIVMTMLLIRT
jgi:lipopolysaccharide export system permease protein